MPLEKLINFLNFYFCCKPLPQPLIPREENKQTISIAHYPTPLDIPYNNRQFTYQMYRHSVA